ncbi:MAG: hypothetical protein ABIK83_04530 [Candidatus Zixiibacteriota bacterium]
MKRRIPLLIVFLVSLFMVIQYYVPLDSWAWMYQYLIDWTIIIGVFALLLGIWSLWRVNVSKIKQRAENWQYAVVTLAGLLIMMIVGFIPGWGNLNNYVYEHFFYYILVPIQATMFSLLAFFISSAAFRAFRARSLLATVLLFAGLVIMIRFVPMGQVSSYISDLSGWILRVPNLAAKRAIIIGIGLGAVATAFKIMFGIERSYLGRD